MIRRFLIWLVTWIVIGVLMNWLAGPHWFRTVMIWITLQACREIITACAPVIWYGFRRASVFKMKTEAESGSR